MSHQEVDYSLTNEANYKANFDYERKDVQQKFIELVCDYFEHMKSKSVFVRIRGLETLFHVFYTVLSYTKNLTVASLNARKAFYLYSEFTEQIAEDSNLVLQLSSKEAVLYVYKKTLYDLNPDFVKVNKQNLDIMFTDILLLKNITENFIQHISVPDLKKMLQKLCHYNFNKDEMDVLFVWIGQDEFREHFYTVLKKLHKLQQQQHQNITLTSLLH